MMLPMIKDATDCLKSKQALSPFLFLFLLKLLIAHQSPQYCYALILNPFPSLLFTQRLRFTLSIFSITPCLISSFTFHFINSHHQLIQFSSSTHHFFCCSLSSYHPRSFFLFFNNFSFCGVHHLQPSVSSFLFPFSIVSSSSSITAQLHLHLLHSFVTPASSVSSPSSRYHPLYFSHSPFEFTRKRQCWSLHGYFKFTGCYFSSGLSKN